MYRLYLLALSLFLLHCQLQAQETNMEKRWGDNTAYTMSGGKWESGIFQSFRYGLNDKIELRSNVIILPILPNAGVKVKLGSTNGFVFASEHSMSYPTLFLKTVSFKGTGGLISPQYDFSFILSISNSLIASKPIGQTSLLSADVGFSFAIRNNRPDYLATIDLPLIYPRMAHYYQGTTFWGGLSFKGTIARRLYYEESARVFLITRNINNLFAENSGTIMWAAGKSLRIKAGYVLSWGRYPFGDHLQLWPTLDFIFGSKN
jgi:hypothetical protein